MGNNNAEDSEFHIGNFGDQKEVAHFSSAGRKELSTLNSISSKNILQKRSRNQDRIKEFR